jgi:two-component system phosphate regulon response regulator PhoB
VFARTQLVDGIWGHAEIDERTVDVHVGRLLKKLSKGRERDPIRTVRSFKRSHSDLARNPFHPTHADAPARCAGA